MGIFIAATAAFTVWAFSNVSFPKHYAHRFRLTVEVDAPNGVRSAASVIEVERKDVTWMPAPGRYEFRVRGEAVFLDFDGWRNLVAILAHGENAEDVSRVNSFWVEAYGRERSEDDDVWSGRMQLRGVVELKPPLIPTLVTFADPLDPSTVRVVQPGEFEAVFGPGFRFRRATLEMVPTGRQGVPVTGGIIEQHLPWLIGMKTTLAGTTTVFTNDIRERLSPRRFKRQDP